jgi:hypothetical protein
MQVGHRQLRQQAAAPVKGRLALPGEAGQHIHADGRLRQQINYLAHDAGKVCCL